MNHVRGPRTFTVSVTLDFEGKHTATADMTIDADDIYQELGSQIRLLARRAEFAAGVRPNTDLAD